MPKNIDPLPSPELLEVLCGRGHGNEVVLRLPGVSMRRASAAVLSVLPLDDRVAQPAARMQVGGSPDSCRFAFHERAPGACAIAQTGELQARANFIFTKGVIAEELRL